MKRLLTLLALAALPALADTATVTNTVLMVDQHGDLNVEGVASVEDVATNAVQVQIADAKAEAAQATANGVTNAMNAVVQNIMSNNVVIYRSGFSDSFAALVVVTEDDRLYITDFRHKIVDGAIEVEIDYVATGDFGAIEPVVMAKNTLDGQGDFEPLDPGDVFQPTYQSGSVTVAGQTYSGYYTVKATVSNPTNTDSYFFWLKIDADAASGDGATLDLPNGVTGGETVDVQWGGKILSFKGGLLKGVANAE